MSFTAPLALLLLPLPFLIQLLRPEERQSGALALPPAIARAVGPAGAGEGSDRASSAGLLLVWALAILALSGPRIEQVLNLLPDSGRDIIITLDLSGSMERMDFTLDGARATRLAAVQSVASTFVKGRAGDRVGFVVFGDRAYVAAAPTHDVAAVAHEIETAVIGVSGKSTAIADGLGLAVKRLRDRQAKSRVIILLSDGQDTSGSVDPVAAAKVAAGLGMRIYTIALGPFDVDSAPSERDVVDTVTLRAIAEAAEGRMFRVRTTADLQAVTAAIDRLEPSAVKAPPIRAWRELWIWPASLALMILAVGLWRGAAA
jgi:Ca-activated chloride channel homolog